MINKGLLLVSVLVAIFMMKTLFKQTDAGSPGLLNLLDGEDKNLESLPEGEEELEKLEAGDGAVDETEDEDGEADGDEDGDEDEGDDDDDDDDEDDEDEE